MDENRNTENSNEELENLAQLFQEELDKTKAEAENNADNLIEHITDWSSVPADVGENDKEESEPEEIKLCERCGKNPRNTDISPDYPYCSECREKMKKVRPKWTNIFLIIPLVAVMLAFVSLFATTIPNFLVVGVLDKMVSQRLIYSASSAYNNYKNSVMYNDDLNPSIIAYNYALNKEIELYDMFNSSYTEDLISACSMTFPKTEKIRERIKTYNSTYEKLDKVLSDKNMEESYAAICEAVDKLASDGKKYDKALLEYAKYQAASLYDGTKEDCLKHLDNIKKISPSYHWMYDSGYFETYISLKEYDKAIDIADGMKSINAEDVNPYIYESFAYRMKGDYETAINLCDAGLKIDKKFGECDRQIAIIKLLQNDYNAAFESAKMSCEKEIEYIKQGYQYDPKILDVFKICCHMKNDEESFNNMINTFEENGVYYYEVSETVTDFIDGKVTLKNIFMEGNGDVR